MDESGKLLWSAGRSYGLITFKREADGSVSIDTTATYDVFNGKASDFNTAVAALARGTYVAVVTNDEPDTSALNTLSNTVKQQGDSVTAQGNSITNLSSSMSLLDRSGPNLFKDGTFESYAAGVSLNGQSTANFVVTTDDAYTGTKCARARRSAAGGSTSNNDIVLTSYMNVRAGQVFYIEMYVKTDLSSTTKTGRVNVGVWTARGTASSWPTAFVIDISKLTDTWQLMSGYVSVPAGMDLARFWMSFPYNASGNTQGTSVLMTSFLITALLLGLAAYGVKNGLGN